MNRIAGLAAPVHMRTVGGEAVHALALGFDDNDDMGYLVAHEEVAHGGPFWIAADHVQEHWLEPDSVSGPGSS